MPEPFHFFTRLDIPELTGLRARNLEELLNHLKTVPGSVIYYHTHHFLRQHQYLIPEPPNDFAYWTQEALNETRLAEQLTSINTSEFSTIRDLRQKIISTLENFLSTTRSPLKEAPKGHEFHFMKSVSFIFPTPYTASTLEEFSQVLKKITIHSLYFHMFEARLRLEKGTNDFSLWVESLGEKELAKKISKLDPYTYTMEGLREKIMRLIKTRKGAPLGHAGTQRI